MNVILIGESCFAFVTKNFGNMSTSDFGDQSFSKTQDFCTKGYHYLVIKKEDFDLKVQDDMETYAIFSDSSDIVLGVDSVPNVSKSEFQKVLNNFISAKNTGFNYFNASCKNFTKTKDEQSVFVQTIQLIPGSFLARIIKEHFLNKVISSGLIIPEIFNLRGYWILVSENKLGGFTIFCGKDDLVAFNSVVDSCEKLQTDVDDTIVLLKQVFKTDVDENDIKIYSVSISDLPIRNVVQLKKEYGDIYFFENVQNFQSDPEPVLIVNDQNYLREKIAKQNFNFFLIWVCIILSAIAFIWFEVTFSEHENLELAESFESQIEDVEEDNVEILNELFPEEKIDSKTFNQLKNYYLSSGNIDRYFQENDIIQGYTSYDGNDQDDSADEFGFEKKMVGILESNYNELQEIKNSVSEMLDYEIEPVKDLSNFKFTLPKAMHLIEYSYNSFDFNREKQESIILIVAAPLSVVKKFSHSSKNIIKDYVLTEISKLKKNFFKIKFVRRDFIKNDVIVNFRNF